jgi:DNA invertase Pin-like site-specific DNA recombinase
MSAAGKLPQEDTMTRQRAIDIYVRVSRRGGRTDEKFHSPEEQEQIARAFLKQRNLPAGVVHTDIDRSGGTTEREGLQEAIGRVRARQSGGIVVAWLDRFSRDTVQGLQLLGEVEEAGGKVYAPDAPEDTTSPEGELQLDMFLAIAKYQRRRARKGFERAKERAIMAGIAVGPVPVGYERTEDRRLVPSAHADAIRELFRLRAAGTGYGALAEFLEREGVVPGRNGTWTRQGIAALLRNRTYLGELNYGEWVNPTACEPLVDLPTWKAAQAPAPKPRPSRGEAPWLLTGLVHCARCGRRLAPWRASARQNRVRRYKCPARDCQPRTSIAADVAEREVIRLLFDLLGADWETREQEAADLAPLEEALEKAERLLAQASTPEAQEALGDEWLSMVGARRAARDEAAAVLGRAMAENNPVASAKVDEEDLRATWDDLSAEERREALQRYALSRVVISGPKPSDVQLELR